MFPFQSRWQWLLNSGYAHIVEATEDQIDLFQDPYKDILEDRAKKMERALRARGVVLVLVNLGIIAAVVAWFALFVPEAGRLEALFSTLAGSLTGISIVFTALWLLLTRYLGQLQADMIASMALGTPGSRQLEAGEEQSVKRVEARARRTSWIPNPFSGDKEQERDDE